MTAATNLAFQDPQPILHIRPITSDDADQLRALYALSLKNNVAGFVQCPDYHGDIFERAQKYRAEGGRMLGLFDNEVLLGFGALKRKSEGRVELCNLHLHPDYHGQGLGLRLARKLIHDAREMDFAVIDLHVTITQQAAIGLYRRLGFRDTRRHVYEVEGGSYDTLFMELALQRA